MAAQVKHDVKNREPTHGKTRRFLSAPATFPGSLGCKIVIKRDGKIHGALPASNGSVIRFPNGTSRGLKAGRATFGKIIPENAARLEKRWDFSLSNNFYQPTLFINNHRIFVDSTADYSYNVYVMNVTVFEF